MGGPNDGIDKYPNASIELQNALENFDEYSKSNKTNKKWYVVSGEFKYRIYGIDNERDAAIQALRNKFTGGLNIPRNYLNMTSIFVAPDGFRTIGDIKKFDTSLIVEEAGLEFDENLGDDFFDKGGGVCQL